MGLKKEREFIKGPIHPDESWWSVVLEDVESSYNLKPVDVDDHSLEEVPIESGNLNPLEISLQNKGEKDEINWDRVQELYDGDEIIRLPVASHNRGGLLVQGDGIQGFVPASHIVELSKKSIIKNREKALSDYVGRSLHLKVIECDQEQGRIVFSERAAQTEPGKRLELLGSLEERDRIEGRVTTITDFGVFVDLGGIEGLIHISELSWGRVCHPCEVVALGEVIEVYILNIDRERSRVALSLKRLHPNPWETVNNRYHLGAITKAVITNIVSFGAFARLEDGLDGLIHISEFGDHSENKGIDEIVAEGQEVDVCIKHIDPTQQRLGLSLHSIK